MWYSVAVMDTKSYRPLEWPTDVLEIMRLLQQDCNRLKVLRVALGWSQVEAAAWAGVSAVTWCKWENGKAPGGANLTKLALMVKDSLGGGPE